MGDGAAPVVWGGAVVFIAPFDGWQAIPLGGPPLGQSPGGGEDADDFWDKSTHPISDS